MSDTATAPVAYLETFGCVLEVLTEDGWEHADHAGDCEWAYRCSVCSTEELPCAVHAPTEFPGLTLAECRADPPHPKAWLYATDAYPPPCMYCAYEAADKAHRGCAHSHHRAWRRWKVASKLVTWGYCLGCIQGSGWSHGDGCKGCVTFTWGKSSYLLGWDRWKWQTLPRCLRRGHWPATSDRCTGTERPMDFCVKCAPCLGCWVCKPGEVPR